MKHKKKSIPIFLLNAYLTLAFLLNAHVLSIPQVFAAEISNQPMQVERGASSVEKPFETLFTVETVQRITEAPLNVVKTTALTIKSYDKHMEDTVNTYIHQKYSEISDLLS